MATRKLTIGDVGLAERGGEYIGLCGAERVQALALILPGRACRRQLRLHVLSRRSAGDGLDPGAGAHLEGGRGVRVDTGGMVTMSILWTKTGPEYEPEPEPCRCTGCRQCSPTGCDGLAEDDARGRSTGRCAPCLADLTACLCSTPDCILGHGTAYPCGEEREKGTLCYGCWYDTYRP